ncbi:MAG TPA: DUF5518 domain-containing protein [Chloroflexia bacterium]|nr:DUF5518 domain-containing protein [Chloroflexia bacterium]
MTPKLYSALKWGALLGGPLAVLETVLYFAGLRGQNQSDIVLSSCVGNALEIIIPVIAGLLAARETGERRSGLIAGVTAGLIVAVVNQISEFMVPADAIVRLFDQPPPTTQELIFGTIQARVVSIALGAWAGWLGGRIGQGLRHSDPTG